MNIFILSTDNTWPTLEFHFDDIFVDKLFLLRVRQFNEWRRRCRRTSRQWDASAKTSPTMVRSQVTFPRSNPFDKREFEIWVVNKQFKRKHSLWVQVLFHPVYALLLPFSCLKRQEVLGIWRFCKSIFLHGKPCVTSPRSNLIDKRNQQLKFGL